MLHQLYDLHLDILMMEDEDEGDGCDDDIDDSCDDDDDDDKDRERFNPHCPRRRGMVRTRLTTHGQRGADHMETELLGYRDIAQHFAGHQEQDPFLPEL